MRLTDGGGLPKRDPSRIGAADDLLESSGGKVDYRQHDFGIDYTTSQNASLCANLLGVFVPVTLGVSTRKTCRTRFPSQNFLRNNQSQTFQIQWNGVVV